MRVEVTSREKLEKRSENPFPSGTAIISIADSDIDTILMKNKPDYLLLLRFDDVTTGDLEFDLGRKISEPEADEFARAYHMFNDEQAKKVAAYINSIQEKVNTLICQCEYGQSRSAGVAAAVREFLYNDGIEIFADDRYYPNKVVYRKVFNALNNYDE